MKILTQEIKTVAICASELFLAKVEKIV